MEEKLVEQISALHYRGLGFSKIGKCLREKREIFLKI